MRSLIPSNDFGTYLAKSSVSLTRVSGPLPLAISASDPILVRLSLPPPTVEDADRCGGEVTGGEVGFEAEVRFKVRSSGCGGASEAVERFLEAAAACEASTHWLSGTPKTAGVGFEPAPALESETGMVAFKSFLLL